MGLSKRVYRCSVLLLALISCSHSWAQNSDVIDSSSNKLVILNWAEYLDPELIQKFEQEYQVQVSEIYYESDAHRTQILLDNNAQGFDLVLTSGVNIEPYVRRGWIAPLNFSFIPNQNNIEHRWQEAFPKAKEYGVPYFWGTTGILYRSDVIHSKIISWMDLFQPLPELKGKISMFSDENEIIGLALKALGYSINEGDNEALAKVESLLHKQKSYVKSYQYLMFSEGSEILSGEVWMAPAYNGDALMIMKHDANLRFIHPIEGTNIWVDYFALGAKANRPDLAHAFINFLNKPSNASKAALYTYAATPNKTAKKLLPDEYLNNPVIFPDQTVLMKSEQYHQISPKKIRQRNAIGARIITGGNNASEF